MKEKTRKILLIVSIIVIAVIILIIENPYRETRLIEQQATKAEVGIGIGNLAPDFELQDLDGNGVRLSDFRGKAVIVNFWATWCPPCKEEMPILNQKSIELSDSLVVLGVNLQENPNAIKPFIKELDISFIILLDPTAEIKSAYDVFTQPVSYFIDRNGIIKARKFGPFTEDELETNINKILK